MAHLSPVFFLIFFSVSPFLAIHALPTGPCPAQQRNATDTPVTNESPTAWPREAIVTLVGVVVAVLSIFVTLILSIPALRELSCAPFSCECIGSSGLAWNTDREQTA